MFGIQCETSGYQESPSTKRYVVKAIELVYVLMRRSKEFSTTPPFILISSISGCCSSSLTTTSQGKSDKSKRQSVLTKLAHRNNNGSRITGIRRPVYNCTTNSTLESGQYIRTTTTDTRIKEGNTLRYLLTIYTASTPQ